MMRRMRVWVASKLRRVAQRLSPLLTDEQIAVAREEFCGCPPGSADVINVHCGDVESLESWRQWAHDVVQQNPGLRYALSPLSGEHGVP